MKIRTILGILLIITMIIGSIGGAAAQQTRDDWVEGPDGVLYPPDWGEDGLPPCGELPSGNGPSWLP